MSLTEWELLAAHAKILALKQQYGLSYKDAAHWLYHPEVKELKAKDDAYATVSGIQQDVDELIMEDIIKDIDSRLSDAVAEHDIPTD